MTTGSRPSAAPTSGSPSSAAAPSATLSGPPRRVLFVDDNAALVEALRLKLSQQPDFQVCGHLPTADDLVTTVAALKPDLVVLDIDMPGRSALAVLGELTQGHPHVRTLILSGYIREDFINQALDAGAWGYVAKSEEPDAIVQTLRQVAAGQFTFSADVARHMRHPAPRK